MKQKSNFSFYKKISILIILLILFTSISAFSYVNAVSSHLCESVFRLHVIANSDSVEDQSLKYKVRDAVISFMNSISEDCSSKEEVIALAQNHIDSFKEIAKQVILENGYSYNVTVSIGNFSFPTKTYGDISLPAGFYDAIRIEIGEGKGQNWWCVMFPPLCFVDVTSGVVPDESKEMMQEELSEEEFRVISEKTPEVQFKFKLLELFTDVANILTAKK